MMARVALFIAFFVAFVAMPEASFAHEFRPAILDLTDLGKGRYEVAWSALGDADISLAIPADCAREAGNAERFVIRCSDRDLAGRAVSARGLGAARADALVRFTGPAGAVTAVLRADSPSFVVPSSSRASTFARASTYFSAGVAHIARGFDHLLFVLGLLLLVRGAAGRAGGLGVSPNATGVARAVTAFTLAHSLTLALAVTASVRLPPAPVEAVIALSLVRMAGEIARPEASPTLARRFPSLLAFAFGLLHGFGFAGGLADLRVPASDLMLALGGFNLGVEAGQLAFVALSLAAIPLIRRLLGAPMARRFALAPAYVIGSIGAYFTLDRLARLWIS